MEMNWCFIIPLLVGLVSAILGYLLGRLFSKGRDNSAEIDALKSKNASLKSDLEACLSKQSVAPTVSGTSAAAVASMSAPAAVFDNAAAKAAFGKTIKKDDLTIVEGIGPKIQELFHNFDVKTWKALSETSVERCQEVLDSGGPRFRIHTPDTWPNQARMASEGRWAELKKWQDEHDHGKQKS